MAVHLALRSVWNYVHGHASLAATVLDGMVGSKPKGLLTVGGWKMAATWGGTLIQSVKLSHVWKYVFFTILHVDVCFLCEKWLYVPVLLGKESCWLECYMFVRHYSFFQACLLWKDSTCRDIICCGCYNPITLVVFVAVNAHTDSLNTPSMMMHICIKKLDHAQKQQSSPTLKMHAVEQLTWVVLQCWNLQLYPENNRYTL